jgi:hypothetical protein
MGTLKDLDRRMKQFSLEAECADIANQRSPILADLVRNQLYKGRAVTGEYLRPFYSEDGWFKSMVQMQAYRAWKQMITPDPDRPADVPNLYIVGYYHEGITARASKSGIEYKNSAGNAAEIEAKYGGAKKLYGLTPQSQVDIQGKIKPALVNRMHLKLFA